MSQKSKSILKSFLTVFHIVALVAIILIAIIAFINPNILANYIKNLESLIQTLGKRNYLILFLIAFLESFPVWGMIIPGQMSILLVSASFKIESFGYVVAIAWIGAWLGTLLGYMLGFFWGERLIDKYKKYIKPNRIERIKKTVSKHGWWMVVTSKFHNTTRAIVSMVVGSMKMNKQKFMIYNAVGTLLRAVFMITLGFFFKEYYPIILEYFRHITLLILVLIVLYIIFSKKDKFIHYIKNL